MRSLFVAVCLLLGGVFSRRTCSKQDVLDHLNITKSNEKFTTCRPALDWTHPTLVYFDIYLYGILSVIEKSQIFIPLIWMSVKWNNERIFWNPGDFCGIKDVILQKDLLWTPDLFVLETAELADRPLNPYLVITHDGNVIMEDDHKIISTCTMNVHKFPFDIQTCHITISSVNHSDKEIKLVAASNSSKVTQMARDSILTQGEWEFLNISVSHLHDHYDGHTFERIKYTISIRRMPLMHFINFHLPILFFLILDLASFFIPDGGEKLCFKVTVLLGISVLLLILNDILPSKSHRCPLIATFVIVIFSFMLLSLLESILVVNVLNKNSEHSGKWLVRADISDSKSEAPTQSLTEMNDLHLLRLILMELQAIKLSLLPQSSSLKAQTDLKRRTGLARCINGAFYTFYLVSMFTFLLVIFIEWKK